MNSQPQLPLENGEITYGLYHVQPVSWQDVEWAGSGYWVRAAITNRRLLVFPERGSYPQDYTIIPPSQIKNAWLASLQGRDGIVIRLHNHHYLYLLVDWGQGSKFARDLGLMLRMPIKPRIAPRVLL